MKSINLLALPGATELTPPDPLKRYIAERGTEDVLALSGLGALPFAQELLASTSEPDVRHDNAWRVAEAMNGTLDAYISSTNQLTGWHKENPSLHARHIARPALVAVLREHADQPVEGEEHETWRLTVARYKQPGLASVMMHYTVYLGGETYMRNGLDVGVVGDQLYAGNGELAERKPREAPVDIADVPGVIDALIEDIAYVREYNDITM